MTSILFIGFLIGMRHALEADHVAAVASLVSSSKSFGESLRQGTAWGIGHTLTLFLFGSVIILMKVAFVERIAMILEFSVGIMLMILGVDVIRRVIQQRIHFHMHQHKNGIRHFHAHSHQKTQSHDDPAHIHSKGFPFRAMLIGMMHGLAGTAALIMLTLQTVTSPFIGVVYMLLFGLGSIVGMAVLSMVIMVPLHHSGKRLTQLYNGMQACIGVGTLCLGAYIVIDIGYVQGLVY